MRQLDYDGQVKHASIAEAKAKLSALIAYVKSGEEVVLTDRGKPVARLAPIQIGLDEATQEMIRLGLIRMPTGPVHMPNLVARSETPIEIEREDRV